MEKHVGRKQQSAKKDQKQKAVFQEDRGKVLFWEI